MCEGACPLKIKIFNRLAWNNKILTIENLTKRGYNRIMTTTCIFCHEAKEAVDHIVTCQFAFRIWTHFTTLFNTPCPSSTLKEVWSFWRTSNVLRLIGLENLLMRVICCITWLERINCIFNCTTLSRNFFICEIDHMFIV